MDPYFYAAIASRDLDNQTPISDRKLRLLDEYCSLRDGLRVLEVGSGKAWLLRQWARDYAIKATGIEPNARFIKFAQQEGGRLGDRLTLFHGDAREFQATSPYDVSLCLGANALLGGFVEAVDWLAKATKPGGLLAFGDVTLVNRPESSSYAHYDYDIEQQVGIINRHGFKVEAILGASQDGYERYASRRHHSVQAWARENAGHKDKAAILERARKEWMHYLTFVRPYLGWTIFVARRDG